MRPIVVGLDPAEPQAPALDWAIREAHLRNRPLDLRLARGLPIPGQYGISLDAMLPNSWAQDVLHRATAHVRHKDSTVMVSSSVHNGSASAVLIAGSEDADMVVLGRASQGRVMGAVLGSTSAQVAAHARAPVVVVNDEWAPHARRPVVVGVDGSPANRAAIEFAFESAQLLQAPLVAVYAWRLNAPEQATLPWMSGDSLRSLFHEQQRLMHEALAGWSPHYPDVHVRRVISRQVPIERLVNEARSAQLLVLGSRGHGGFRGLMLGSVSQGILHRPQHCPIAIVHDGDRPPAA